MSTQIETTSGVFEKIVWHNTEKYQNQKIKFIQEHSPVFSQDLLANFDVSPETARVAAEMLAAAIFVGRELFESGINLLHLDGKDSVVKIGYNTTIKNKKIGGFCIPTFLVGGEEVGFRDILISKILDEKIEISRLTVAVTASSVIGDILLQERIREISIETEVGKDNPGLVDEMLKDRIKKVSITAERDMIEEVAHALFWLQCINNREKLVEIINELSVYPSPEFCVDEQKLVSKELSTFERNQYEDSTLEKDARLYTRKFLSVYYPKYIHLS